MKNTPFLLISLACLGATSLAPVVCGAQTPPALCNGLSKDTLSSFILFTGKHCMGKNYLQWNVECQQENGTYMIYKSSDGTNYELLGHKKGIGVPISTPIAYCFQDENPCEGITYYRVVHITQGGKYRITENITVLRPSELLSGSTFH